MQLTLVPALVISQCCLLRVRSTRRTRLSIPLHTSTQSSISFIPNDRSPQSSLLNFKTVQADISKTLILSNEEHHLVAVWIKSVYR